MDFVSFIRSRREILQQAQRSKSNVEIVLGNESCDLDSAVGAVAYAFLLQSENPHLQYIPVLNVSETDYQLKTEVVFLFSKHSINQSDLVFINDLDILRRHGELFNVHLVDHNEPTPSQGDLADKVRTIVDHHATSTDFTHDNKAFVRIEVIGSCCSLIADLYYERLGTARSNTIAHLLRGTILTDTICLSENAGKVKPLDVAMLEKLEGEFKLDPLERKCVFHQINDAKENVSEFSTEQLLRKDLASFTVSTTTVVISSMNIGIQKFLERANVLPACTKVLQKRSAHVIAMICAAGAADGVFVKHFLLYSRDNQLKSRLMEMVDSDHLLQFVESSEFPDRDQLTIRQFANPKISRKQVFPKLREFLELIITSEDLLTKLRSDSDQLTFSLELSAPGTPAVVESPAPELNYSSHENSGSHTPNPTFYVGVPPNSYKDPSMVDQFSTDLPSFNNSEMVKRIMIKKNKLGADHMEPDSTHGDVGSSENNSGNNSCPFTPANSFVDKFSTFEHHLPSFNSREMVQRMLQKKLPLVGESGDVSPSDESSTQQIFTPHTSECEGDLGSSPAFDQSDLEHRLSTIEASDQYKSGTQRVQDTAHSLVDSALEQAINTVSINGDNHSP